MNGGGSGNTFISLFIMGLLLLDWGMQVTEYWLFSWGNRIWTKVGHCYSKIDFLIDK